MKTNILNAVTVASLCLSIASLAHAQSPDLSLRLREMNSRVESMQHGYHSDAEWDTVLSDLNALALEADNTGQVELRVKVSLLQAAVYRDARGNDGKAVTVLETARSKYDDRASPAMRKVYAGLAELYSRLGDEEQVRVLIDAFRKSPSYDPDAYAFSGGQGPGDPLRVVRPQAGSGASTTITSMQTQRAKARLAPGNPFPDFQSTDAGGRSIRLSDYRGKVVLVDFWVTGWYPWERELPSLVETYRRYRSQGFEIIGVNMNRDRPTAEAFAQSNGLSWPQVMGDAKLPAGMGIFGEATGFLVDRNGVVIGRDLRGADLDAAIASALKR